MRMRQLRYAQTSKIESIDYSNGQLSYFSLKGNTKKKNEDALLVGDFKKKCKVLLVADGMGGHPGGDEASGLIVDTIKSKYQRAKDISVNQKLFQTLDLCNQLVIDMPKDAGSTFCMAILYEKSVQFVSAGDSLALVISPKGEAIYASIEENSVALADEIGAAPVPPFLLNYIGFERITYQVSPHVALSKGDQVFLMSDGAHEFFAQGDEHNLEGFVQKLLMPSGDTYSDDATCICFTR